MNEMGLTLAWAAVQVAIFLAPALALHALASRRGPAAGAWVAALCLGLVVALNITAFLPRIARNDTPSANETARPARPLALATRPGPPAGATGSPGGNGRAHSGSGPRLSLAWLGLAWDRLERGAAAPAARCRPWGSVLAAIALAGTGAGMVRLLVGLWAVALCRRRGRAVDDPAMNGLLEEMRCAMGCRPPVALREVPDLTTPATAGRRRPVLLLPDDWRTWDTAERRAVLAHELAHVVRGDYVAGLLAQLALVLNWYHPLVQRLAGRLRLQQEQAADALGAHFVGGPRRYLLALSSLALKQDGRFPCWPARAFLPGRGTLIRRIAMLRDQSRKSGFDPPRRGAQRLPMALALVGLTAGVAALRGPARGDEGGAPPAGRASAPASARRPGDLPTPSGSIYTREGADGVVMVRPAAALRHKGMDRVVDLILEEMFGDMPLPAKRLKIDTSRPGFVKLRCHDIEWVTVGLGFGRTRDAKSGRRLHTVELGTPAIRMVAPFDWLAFLRQWRLECEEVRVGSRAYYKITGELAKLWGPGPACVFLPDDRTLVCDGETVIRKIAGGEMPARGAYLRGKDWERASAGLLAIAIKNDNDAMVKNYDLGRPDDAMVVPLLKGVDWWILGVDDADPIVLFADAACRSRDAALAVCRSLDSLIKLGRDALEHAEPATPGVRAREPIVRMQKALLAGIRVELRERTIAVRAQRFGSLGDLAAVIQAETQEARPRVAGGKDDPKSVKR